MGNLENRLAVITGIGLAMAKLFAVEGAKVAPVIEELQARIGELEAEVAQLRTRSEKP
jgi:hypothetical protein